MYRTLAIVMLALGFLLVGISSLSYAHMRQIVFGNNPSNALNQFDVRIMTIGMADSGATVDAAGYCRQLTMRVYGVFGAGLGLLGLSAALFTGPRSYRRKQSDK